jgi:putative transcriptional regulator
MSESSFLSDHFLIAMPGLEDPNFAHTVTYLCEHNAEGALGLVINRVSSITLGDLLDQMEDDAARTETRLSPVLFGGPVQRDRGFVLHSPVGHWEATLPIRDDMGLSTSRDILTALARGEGPDRALVALGYAGWGAGQLEQEMAGNAWLSGPADPQVIFDVPLEQRWQAAAASMGVDMNLITGDAGHA